MLSRVRAPVVQHCKGAWPKAAGFDGNGQKPSTYDVRSQVFSNPGDWAIRKALLVLFAPVGVFARDRADRRARPDRLLDALLRAYTPEEVTVAAARRTGSPL